MGIADTVYRNTLYLSVADIVSKALQFVVMLQATRLLPQEDFGKFSLALSISFITIVIADMGINNFLIRQIARSKKDLKMYVMNAVVLKVLFLISTLALTALFMALVGYPSNTRTVVYVMWMFTCFGVFTEMYYAVFRSFEAMHIDAMLKVMRMVLLTILSIFMLWKGFGVVAFGFSFVVVEGVIALIAALIGRQRFIGGFKFEEVSVMEMKTLLKDAFPFGISYIFGSIYFYVGVVILSILKGDVDVAVFNGAYNVVLAILFIPTTFTSAVYPALSRLFLESKQKMSVLYERSFKYLVIIGLPVSVLTFFLANMIVGLLYHDQYTSSGVVLRIISLYMLLKFVNFLFGILLSSADRQWERVKSQGLVAVLSIVIGILFIGSFGTVGAALAIVVTEIILFGVYFHHVNEFAPTVHLLRGSVKPLLAAAVMALCIIYLPFSILVSAAIGCAMYVTVLFVVGTFDDKDKEIVRGIYENVQKNW